MHGSNSTLGMDVEAARWMREAPEHDPTPLRCSEWYSTTPLRNTLERAVVVLWYHCGTLRLAEIFSGAGSQQLSPTGTYTPTTQLTHQRHTATHPATRKSYPQVIHRFIHMHYTAYWSSFHIPIFHVVFLQHSRKKVLPFLPVPL